MDVSRGATAILPADLGIPDLGIAARVLAHARTFAPCLDLIDEMARVDAIAILSGVAQEAAQRGSRMVARQGVGSASVQYMSAASWFTDDDRAALQALAGTVASHDHPVGRFPAPERAYRSIWPESPCS